MKKEFHQENRASLCQSLAPGSLLLLFSGHAPRKTGDEDYPYFADRSFVYYTGIEQQDSILAILVDKESVQEMLFMLPPDAHAERWNGKRLSPQEAQDVSGISDFRYLTDFSAFLDKQLVSGAVSTVCLDFDRKKEGEQPVRQAFILANKLRENYPYVTLSNIHNQIKAQRTIKKPCEIDAMRYAETITCEGIQAMMRASRDGMYEYQYKAEFDYALAQRGVLSPGFPSIISSGKNNFKIHYYDYRGQAQDGDMILNDVGAVWDYEINDVSRAFPCNGRFNDRQKLLYECIYNTSEYMFSTLKPGVPLLDVDKIIRKYTFEQLKEAGVCKNFEDIGTYMWHGGAHHVGFDVHDVVEGSGLAVPGVVFCVDIGVYHEEWGIGFRLEDNCLITEDGCENLSRAIPRQIDEIEAFMGRR